MAAKAKSAKAKPSPASPITRRDFIGVKMANFLYALKYNKALPEETRKQAQELQEQWDSVCPFAYRLNNPIVMSELERVFKTGEMK